MVTGRSLAGLPDQSPVTPGGHVPPSAPSSASRGPRSLGQPPPPAGVRWSPPPGREPLGYSQPPPRSPHTSDTSIQAQLKATSSREAASSPTSVLAPRPGGSGRWPPSSWPRPGGGGSSEATPGCTVTHPLQAGRSSQRASASQAAQGQGGPQDGPPRLGQPQRQVPAPLAPAGLAQRQGRGRGLPVPRPPQPPGRRDHRRVSALRAPRSALRLRDAPRWASLCSRLCNDWKGSTNPANRSAPGGGGAGLGRGGLSTARTPGQHLPGTPPPAPAPKASGFTPPGPHTDRSLCRDRPSCGLLGLSLAPLPPRQAGWCR